MLPSIFSRREMAAVILPKDFDQGRAGAHLLRKGNCAALFADRFQVKSEHLLAPVFIGGDLMQIAEIDGCFPVLEADFFVVDPDGDILSQIDRPIRKELLDVGDLVIRFGKIAPREDVFMTFVETLFISGPLGHFQRFGARDFSVPELVVRFCEHVPLEIKSEFQAEGFETFAERGMRIERMGCGHFAEVALSRKLHCERLESVFEALGNTGLRVFGFEELDFSLDSIGAINRRPHERIGDRLGRDMFRRNSICPSFAFPAQFAQR